MPPKPSDQPRLREGQGLNSLSLCAVIVYGLGFVGLSGCTLGKKELGYHSPGEYQTQPPVEALGNGKASPLNSRGVKAYRAGNLEKAEDFFRKALAEDVSFGPAHNNLGQLFLDRHQLYLAAWEFEYAASLMPELVEPIINQGRAYEMGGRLGRALEFYQSAYELNPQHPAAISHLVRVRIKQDADVEEVAYLLDELLMHESQPEWVSWAQELRNSRYLTECATCEGDCQCEPVEMGQSQPHVTPGNGSVPYLLPVPNADADGPSFTGPNVDSSDLSAPIKIQPLDLDAPAGGAELNSTQIDLMRQATPIDLSSGAALWSLPNKQTLSPQGIGGLSVTVRETQQAPRPTGASLPARLPPTQLPTNHHSSIRPASFNATAIQEKRASKRAFNFEIPSQP